MNSSEKDFQIKLDEIGKLYEDGKDAINSFYTYIEFDQIVTALQALQKLRDIAAMSVKAAYQIKEN